MIGIKPAAAIRSLFIAIAIAVATFAMSGAHAEAGKPHRIVIHVDQNDAAVMNLALSNARNVLDYYRDKHEDVAIEIVAYGPGLHMLRDDTSPVKDRIKELSDVSFPSKIVFSACNNTKEGMEKREGHPITIIPQAGIVPAGVVRIIELEEQGYSYVKP
jgi:intracellular sulfur oxidation DsrE/DsrF family protein